MSRADAPVGVFDSGLGGLTVVQRIHALLPQESLVYVADQAHVPYGGRPLEEVRGFACAISEALLSWGCKAVVMACNISSATALAEVQARHPGVPILGVILPGAQSAFRETRNGRIGVLATEGTVRSGAYTRALHALAPNLRVAESPCPAFVPLVEAGETETPQARAAACDYLAPLLAAEADTVILGCTHYPFLLPVLRAIAPTLAFVDPAEQTACELASLLAQAGLRAPALPAASASPPRPAALPSHPAPTAHRRTSDTRTLLATSGDADAFAAQVRRFLPDAAQTARFAPAFWQSNRLDCPFFTRDCSV